MMINNFKNLKKVFSKHNYILKDISFNDCEICVEKRNEIVYLYIFHRKYFISDRFDDSNVVYNVNNDDFYNMFEYVIDNTNEWSINEYKSVFKTEKECIEALKKLNVCYNIM